LRWGRREKRDEEKVWKKAREREYLNDVCIRRYYFIKLEESRHILFDGNGKGGREAVPGENLDQKCDKKRWM